MLHGFLNVSGKQSGDSTKPSFGGRGAILSRGRYSRRDVKVGFMISCNGKGKINERVFRHK